MIKFIYFDLGNVLVTFDHRVMARQMSAVAGISAERLWEIVFEGEFVWQYEQGEITSREFYDIFCEQAGTRPDYDAFLRAGSDIFDENGASLAIVDRLRAAGHRLGILSNTNAMHWEFIRDERFSHIPAMFEIHALSFELHTMKPQPEIYSRAAELAGVACDEIFFTDDRQENIDAATAAGYHAHLFLDATQLEHHLTQLSLL